MELFITLDGEKGYYNFEFNAIGTCLLYYGNNRYERKVIDDRIVETIESFSTIQKKLSKESKPKYHWELTIVIPVSAFSEHSVAKLSGMSCSANVYKCGDDLPNPHFLAWSNIKSEEPDFHRPEFFGKMAFL